MRSSRTRVVLAIAAVLTLLPMAAVPAMARDNGRAEHDRIVAHWTKERIANAVPRDLAKGADTIAAPKGKPRPPTTPPPATGSVKGASWTKGGPILAKTGKVVFTMDGGDWI